MSEVKTMKVLRQAIGTPMGESYTKLFISPHSTCVPMIFPPCTCSVKEGASRLGWDLGGANSTTTRYEYVRLETYLCNSKHDDNHLVVRLLSPQNL